MHCWARYLFVAVVALLGIGQMIAACGQKGDLYLPDPEENVAEQGTAGPRTGEAPEIQTGEELEVETEATGAPPDAPERRPR